MVVVRRGGGGERAQTRGAEGVEVAQAFCAVEVGGLVGREEEGVFCVRGEVGPPAWGAGSGGRRRRIVVVVGGGGGAARDARERV